MHESQKSSHLVGILASALTAVAIVAGAMFWIADAHNDNRYVQKVENSILHSKVDQISADVQTLTVNQAVNSNKIENIQHSTDELKQGQDTMNTKLDRLIERR